MDMKFTYHTSRPNIAPSKHFSCHYILHEFAKTDAPFLEIEFGDHYLNFYSGLKSWGQAIRATGYAMRIHADKLNNRIIIEKIAPDEEA